MSDKMYHSVGVVGSAKTVSPLTVVQRFLPFEMS